MQEDSAGRLQGDHAGPYHGSYRDHVNKQTLQREEVVNSKVSCLKLGICDLGCRVSCLPMSTKQLEMQKRDATSDSARAFCTMLTACAFS